MPSRRRALLRAMAGTAWVLPAPPAAGQALRLFPIGTRRVAGTCDRVGTLSAAVISQPPAAPRCERGGNCGVAGLLAEVPSAKGSVADIEALRKGELDSGFAPADVAWWAHWGEGPLAFRPLAEMLPAIAWLETESLHRAVAADSGIASVRELRGRRISLDEEGSGTRLAARLAPKAPGLSERDREAVDVRADEAVSRMRPGRLDGFFSLAGDPVVPVRAAARDLGARRVPIRGDAARKLIADCKFCTYGLISSATYDLHPAVETLGVNALWLMRADLEEELINSITRALFHRVLRPLLASGHLTALEIQLETAFAGVTVPLHPGPERF